MYEKMAVRATAPVTIKDISARLNVSSVSVHRALSGKEGVSDQLRARVLNTAREMGYEVNYAAASLKRKTCRVAVVLPQDDDLYFAYIWKGLRSRIQELKGLNVVVDGFVCRDEADQAIDLIIIAKYLERIADHAVNIAQWAIFCVTGEILG